MQMGTRASLFNRECAVGKEGLPDVAQEIKTLRRAQWKTQGTVLNRNVQGCNE